MSIKETAKDQPVDAKNGYQGEAIHQTQDKPSKTNKTYLLRST